MCEKIAVDLDDIRKFVTDPKNGGFQLVRRGDGKIHFVEEIGFDWRKDRCRADQDGGIHIYSYCGKKVEGYESSGIYGVQDTTVLCRSCLIRIGFLPEHDRIKRTEITAAFNRKYRDAIVIMEMVGLTNTTTDITAKNGHLRFHDPKTGADYVLDEKHPYPLRRNGSCVTRLNRTKSRTVHRDSYTYVDKRSIPIEGIFHQACKAAPMVLSYRKRREEHRTFYKRRSA